MKWEGDKALCYHGSPEYWRRMRAQDAVIAGLPTMVRSQFVFNNILASRQVARMSDDELRDMRQIGKKGLAAIRAAIPYGPPWCPDWPF